jgi:hypothetical protein
MYHHTGYSRNLQDQQQTAKNVNVIEEKKKGIKVDNQPTDEYCLLYMDIEETKTNAR